ncbi:PP2C family protein-serine/threonine phosphatase, partial [Streptomyces sp. NPDC057757]|uniref:PP2C family protein-serine/threonine phosphatase n=1 Tax=Streptomyces sp. NPDC057757 TaxID=3346241 RepID=UPI0036CADB9A
NTGLRFTLTTRTTLAQARTELAGNPIDCILLDLHLPDVSGVNAVTSVRELAPHTAVIVLTGLSEDRAGTDAMAAGAQDYLVKGKVEADLLQRTLRYAVYRSQTERASAEAQAARLRAEENARLERGLLPQPMLDTSTVKVTSRYLPGAEMALLGGDFLDVVEGDDGLLHAVVGDVSGHGPDAAALGVCLRIAWRSLVLGGHRGNDLLHLMERILMAERGSQQLFATCTLLTLDQDAGTATLHLAGHHEPLLTTEAGTRELTAAHGIALGIVPEIRSWPSTVIPLPATGALTLYT